MKPVLIIATLDTKGAEAAFLRETLAARGIESTVMDAGVLGEPHGPAEISGEAVARAAGESLGALRARGDRGRAVAAMAEGAAKLARELHETRGLAGVLGLGGSAGSMIASAAMRALPIGVPKLLLSTLASGDTRPYVGTKDILMMYPVADFTGLNRLTRQILWNAAHAMAGMAAAEKPVEPAGSRRLIAATMFGVTTPCVNRARELLEARGFEMLVFHATGSGGRSMEELIADGFIEGVLDITTTELADELVGGVLSAGPDRLEIAGKLGLPQVISVGALDMVNFGPPDTIPEKFRGRRFYQHNPTVTLMRTTPEECVKLGEWIAQKANAARRPAAVVLPLRGISAIDAPGQPFHDPAADEALFAALRANLAADRRPIEIDAHINDAAFADALAQTFLELWAAKGNLEARR